MQLDSSSSCFLVPLLTTYSRHSETQERVLDFVTLLRGPSSSLDLFKWIPVEDSGNFESIRVFATVSSSPATGRYSTLVRLRFLSEKQCRAQEGLKVEIWDVNGTRSKRVTVKGSGKWGTLWPFAKSTTMSASGPVLWESTASNKIFGSARARTHVAKWFSEHFLNRGPFLMPAISALFWANIKVLDPELLLVVGSTFGDRHDSINSERNTVLIGMWASFSRRIDEKHKAGGAIQGQRQVVDGKLEGKRQERVLEGSLILGPASGSLSPIFFVVDEAVLLSNMIVVNFGGTPKKNDVRPASAGSCSKWLPGSGTGTLNLLSDLYSTSCACRPGA
ncbi:hypothetical protein B0H11DRAFT_1933509 [Mycena galericulata]|nr:hypothetical protein B0H11DRAFT_1933509 [Mycena galericulata]